MLNFGPFTLDSSERELRRSGELIGLPPKVFDLLAVLASRPGKLVTKDELMRELWPDSFVDEANLTQNVFILRRALGEGEDGTKYIETVPRRGYRFVAALQPADSAAPTESAPAAASATRQPRRLAWVVAGLVVIAGITAFVVQLRRTPPPSFETISVRRLTTTGDIVDAAMSPDARFVAFVRVSQGRWSLWLYQVATGNTLQIGQDEPAPVDKLTFSADGERLYFVRNTPQVSSVHAIATLGGASRHVIDGTASPVAVSPDGSRLAFVRWSPNTGERHLVVTDAFGANPQSVLVRKSPAVIVYQGAGWSPDGSRLAVIVNESFSGRAPELVVVDAATRVAAVLTRDLPWNAGKVVWHPDGDELIVAAGQLWRVSYPSGVVSQITREAANYGHLSMARSGQTLMAVQRAETSTIWVAEDGSIERATATVSEAGYNHGLSWLPDGRLLYESHTSGNPDLWVSALDGRPATRITTDPMSDQFPAAAGDRILVFASAKSGGSTIWRRDLDGRDERQISADGVQYAPDRSPDGKQVVFHRAHPTASWTVWRVSIDGTGLEEISHRPSTFPVYSPDGRFIACNYLREGARGGQWGIAILPAAGGDPVLFLDVNGPPTRRLAWSPTGTHVYIAAVEDGLSRVAVAAGAESSLVARFPGESVLVARWSIDGRRLAYVRHARQDDVVLVTSQN